MKIKQLNVHCCRLPITPIERGGIAPYQLSYRLATHGCIRLHPDDVDDLFHHVRLGEPGEVIYEPVLASFDGAAAYLEVHPDFYQSRGDPLLTAVGLLDRLGLAGRIDLPEVARIVREQEGLAVRLTIRR